MLLVSERLQLRVIFDSEGGRESLCASCLLIWRDGTFLKSPKIKHNYLEQLYIYFALKCSSKQFPQDCEVWRHYIEGDSRICRNVILKAVKWDLSKVKKSCMLVRWHSSQMSAVSRGSSRRKQMSAWRSSVASTVNSLYIWNANSQS